MIGCRRSTNQAMKRQWFVIHTLAGQEQKVKENIKKRWIQSEEMKEYIKDVYEDVLVPEENVAEVRGGKKTVTKRKLYPGYVFINIALLDDDQQIVDRPWYFVQETPGIIGFIGGDRPTPTSDEEIEMIKTQISESEGQEKPKIDFEVGETVKINDGPFLNFNGVIEEIEPDRGKLRVTVNIFGRNTPVDLEYWQVEKA